MLGTMVVLNIVHPSEITRVLKNKVPNSPSVHSLVDVPPRGFVPVGTRPESEEQGTYR